jgi:hypothetical protein
LTIGAYKWDSHGINQFFVGILNHSPSTFWHKTAMFCSENHDNALDAIKNFEGFDKRKFAKI